MAQIVLGIGTSHTPMLSIPPELWRAYAENDQNNGALVFPPDGAAMPFSEAVDNYVPTEVQARVNSDAEFEAQYARCQTALDSLARYLEEASCDVVVIVSDDQDEWFYDSNMPSLAVYWDDEVPMFPRPMPADASAIVRYTTAGYADRELTVPVDAPLARHLIDHLMDEEFDVARVTGVAPTYGGRVARRYPTLTGELDLVRETRPRAQGLPHGYSFVVKRLLHNAPPPIVPIFQNTCYPPNHVRPHRAYAFGEAIGRAIAAWPEDVRVAVVASGGLSHFVVDEETDRTLLTALVEGDRDILVSLPRHRLYSATSESLNWVTAAGAMATTELRANIVDYVPVYRTKAGTGGGWAFCQWK